jgi:two-component system sensor histidine kinase/response regulator
MTPSAAPLNAPETSAAGPLGLAPLPGLDTADGLRRLGGNAKLYRRLLERFVQEQADAPARISASLQAGDREGAVRAAHTLKGVAGNLGLHEVHERAAALEDALFPAQQEALATALDAVLPALAAALAAAPEPPEARLPAGAAPADAAAAAQVVARLREQLEGFDAAAGDTVEAEREALAALLGEDTLAKLGEAVGRYAFDEALALLPAPSTDP